MFEGLQAIRKELKEAKLENPDREEIHDGYQLRFVGKDYAKFMTGLPTETVLVPDTEWNNQEQNKNSENIFITGDNLDALKHLENAYSGRIKMIYIDPPYNTGSDGFVYKDKFGFSEEELREKLGLTGTEVARVKALEDRCSHSAWLTFMLPRLAIAKRLLTSDGVIFISIDDNEQANLKLLCDEIFTERNFVSELVWEKKKKGSFLSDAITNVKEYILVYCKDKKSFKGLIGEINENPETYPCVNATNKRERRIIPAGIESKYIKSDYYLPKGSVISDTTMNLVLCTDLNIQNGKLREDVIIEGNWRYNQETMTNYAQNNELYITRDLYIRRIVKDERYKTLKDLLPRVEEDDNNNNEQNDFDINHLFKQGWGTNEDADEELRLLFGVQKIMSYPKPLQLIRKLLASYRNCDNAIILDFFAGSSTTAHAVMALNKEDSGNRKYIMVQLDEPTYEIKNGKKFAKKNSEAAFEAGYESIDQISRDRIKKATEQLGDISGFKHYKLAKIEDKKILDKIDTFNPENRVLIADDMLKPFSGKSLNTTLTATGIQTLLTTWLVDDGYTLTTPVHEIKFDDYSAYMPQDSHRLYLIDTGWDSEATKELLNRIGKNELVIQSIVIYSHSFDFTSLTELKNNLKSVIDNKIEMIERF